jgi:cation transport ATPase
MQEENVSINHFEADFTNLEEKGKTLMILAVDGRSVGLVGAIDASTR